MDEKFLRGVQDFGGNALSVSVVRRMGPEGTLDSIRDFIKKRIDLREVSTADPSEYRSVLDELTDKLRSRMPSGARHWGVARKCLNLFFRDALYNFYLRQTYDLAKFERHLEIPLDSYVGRALWLEDRRLPRWRTVKGLTPKESEKFQEVASQVAERNGTHRVHLDVIYWRGNL
jgi:hypothetical protein